MKAALPLLSKDPGLELAEAWERGFFSQRPGSALHLVEH